MNEEYWKGFYKKFKVNKPSTFAKFCMNYIDTDKPLLDIGCGNGRDTYFFARQGINTIGVDLANQPKPAHNATFMQQDYRNMPFNYNQVYARFFLHSVENLDIVRFLRKCQDLVMLEFRNIGDVPTLYPEHERNLIDGRSVFNGLADHGFSILYYQLSQGLSQFQGEDPLLCRIIAKKS